MQPNVHDAFFKAMFSRVEHAASELQLVLSPALSARIDFRSLALCPGSFVDEALKERQSDLLFSASLGGHPALIGTRANRASWWSGSAGGWTWWARYGAPRMDPRRSSRSGGI